MLLWTRLGVTVGFIGISYIVLVEVLQDTKVYLDYSLIVSIGLIILGAYLGWTSYRRAKQQAEELDQEDLALYEGAYLFLATGQQQFGLMIACLGAICIFLVPPTYQENEVLPIDQKKVVNAAQPPPLPELTNAPPPVVETNESPTQVKVPEWPRDPLNFQGLNLDPNRPSIIVDGRTYEIGESLQGAEIMEITRSNVTVNYLGVRHTYPVPEF